MRFALLVLLALSFLASPGHVSAQEAAELVYVTTLADATAFPGYARNLGTLEPIATAETIVVATNRILHDAEHPSHVLLPVVPREGAPELAFER